MADLSRISLSYDSEISVQQSRSSSCFCFCRRTSQKMSKQVIVIRHGQAEHNVDVEANLRRHVKLTEQGNLQCIALCNSFRDLPLPDLVISSPLMRTLQTTQNIFKDTVPVVVHGDAREVWREEQNLCEAPFDLQDNGEPPSEFENYDWEPVRIATGAIQSSRRSSLGRVMMRAWERRCVEMDQDFKRLKARAARLSRYIESRPEATICLVSHAAILGLVTGDDKEGPMNNCEVRVYRLRRGRWTRLQTIPAPTRADTLRVAMEAVADAVEPPQPQHSEPLDKV
jgi:broad specificity phosphatase PhoE